MAARHLSLSKNVGMAVLKRHTVLDVLFVDYSAGSVLIGTGVAECTQCCIPACSLALGLRNALNLAHQHAPWLWAPNSAYQHAPWHQGCRMNALNFAYQHAPWHWACGMRPYQHAPLHLGCGTHSILHTSILPGT